MSHDARWHDVGHDAGGGLVALVIAVLIIAALIKYLFYR